MKDDETTDDRTNESTDGYMSANPGDPIDPSSEGRVVNRIGPGLDEPEKGTGQQTSPEHAERVPTGEGARAPHVEEIGHAEHSVYDGSGKEVVVVTTVDRNGYPAQGSGATAEDALTDARKNGYPNRTEG